MTVLVPADCLSFYFDAFICLFCGCDCSGGWHIVGDVKASPNTTYMGTTCIYMAAAEDVFDGD